MSDQSEYVDYAKVRDLLLSAQERRHELSYEQQMALQHSEWAASAQRGGIKTNSEVFQSLSEALQSNHKLADHPDVCAKIAELMPHECSINACHHRLKENSDGHIGNRRNHRYRSATCPLIILTERFIN